MTLLLVKLCKLEEDFCFIWGLFSLNTFINISVIDYSCIFYLIKLSGYEWFNGWVEDWD